MKTKDIRNAGIIVIATGIVLAPLVRYIIGRIKTAKAGLAP